MQNRKRYWKTPMHALEHKFFHGVSAAAAFIAAVAWSGTATAQSAPSTLIRNVNIVTLDKRGTIKAGALLLRGKSIARIYKAGEPLPAGAQVVEGNGKYVIPGLIDAHIHIDEAESLVDYLRYGVTTAFSLGTPDRYRADLLAILAKQKSGNLPGAKLYSTGPTIGGQRRMEATAEAVPFVNELQKDGLSFVKVYNGVPKDVFNILADEAHKRGMGVFGHIPRGFPAAESLRKIDVIVHMEEFFFALNHAIATDSALAQLSPEWAPDIQPAAGLLDQIAARQGAIIPNLVASAIFQTWWLDEDALLNLPDAARFDPETREGWRTQNYSRRNQVEKRMLREEIKAPYIRKLTYLAQKKGVLLLAGSDAAIPGLYPGRSLHQELRLLVAAGLTNEEALRAATLNGGKVARKHVDRSTCIGAIEVGCEADLVLLNADPIESVRNVGQIHAVIADGVMYTPQQLADLGSQKP